MVLLDSDDDEPEPLRRSLEERARRKNLPVAVVLAVREFEAWLLGSKESLRGQRGIRDDASTPDRPETIRGAKEALSRNMSPRHYLEVDDQAALTSKFDLEASAQRCPSFAAFRREVARLTDAIGSGDDAPRTDADSA